ncbi:MAG: FtsW/RodA/SpoVE family cell cycle protein [Oscillospiraceae bacterium]|jgi:cell division protein FtsW (lipid II flippase)|nr:FtsW/RodA/SpoVE family cell cycle protein [Oscillospiraceae bacterium]
MFDWIRELFNNTSETTAGFDGEILSYVTMVIRFILPVLAIIIVVRCVRSLLTEKGEGEIWGQLHLLNGNIIDLNYWENTLGRSGASDAFFEYPTISKNHAALNRDDKGDWHIYDVASKAGVLVNGTKVVGKDGFLVKSGDKIDLGGLIMTFVAADGTDEYEQAISRTPPGQIFKQALTLVYITVFQVLLCVQLSIAARETFSMTLVFCFLILLIMMWICYFVTRAMHRVAFEVESIGFFLTTIGLSIVASASPNEMTRQMMFIVFGLILFYGIGWVLRDLNRAKMIRRPVVLIGPLLLAITLIFGQEALGAIRWISIAGMQFQPGEFVKIAIIFAGAVTLERMFIRRNLIGFVAIMAICMGLLAGMTDFGTAMIFFVTFLVIAFLRSGDVATVILSVAGAGFAGLVALASRPHIAQRFATWGNAWQTAYNGGRQQASAMSAAASGGLFGVGAGEGWLKGGRGFPRVFAADSDIVFAMLSEELGLIIALTAIAAILLLAVYSVQAAKFARSTFYVIAACAAATVLVFQMMLNVLGSMDILPFTGVTFPVISKGGTSLISCWGMLAFFKAIDTRAAASFAVKIPKRPEFSGGGAIIYRRYDDDNTRVDPVIENEGNHV